MHWLERDFPDQWAWAFADPDPAYIELSQRELAEELTSRTGQMVTKNTVDHILRRLANSVPSHDPTDPEATTSEAPPFSPEESVEGRLSYQQQILQARAEQRYLKELLDEEARRRAFLEALREGVVPLPAPAPFEPRPVYPMSEAPHSLILQWSDMHAGQFVDPAFVGDRFSYDKFILEDSVQRMADVTLKFAEIYRNSYPVNRLVIFALGDMVHGSDLHQNQQLEVDRNIGTIGRQVVYTGRLMAETVRAFAASFMEVVVICVSGNHGRIGKFRVNDYTDNFDWLAYHNMEAWLSGLPNVKVLIADVPVTTYQLDSKLFMAQHGDDIRSWGISPANAVKQATLKDIVTQEVIPDYTLMGHFHNAYEFQAGGKTEVKMNGGWPGGDRYSVRDLKSVSTPSQNLFLFHPQYGIVATHRIWLRRDTESGPTVPVNLNTLFTSA